MSMSVAGPSSLSLVGVPIIGSFILFLLPPPREISSIRDIILHPSQFF